MPAGPRLSPPDQHAVRQVNIMPEEAAIPSNLTCTIHTDPDTRCMSRLHIIAQLALLLVLLLCLPAHAQTLTDPTPLTFHNSAEEQRFHALVSELRCVMCQNQSLADSNAQIARDLRHEVLGLMQQGRSDSEIKDFLVQRYGEFVLYRPPFAAHTWLLWLAPAVLATAGALVVAHIVRRRAHALTGEADVAEDDDGDNL